MPTLIFGYAQFVQEKSNSLKASQSFETATPIVVVREMISPWENCSLKFFYSSHLIKVINVVKILI